MITKKMFAAALFTLLTCTAILQYASPCAAGEHEKQLAQDIGGLLVSALKPEELSITVGSADAAWIEAKGVRMDGKMRVDAMRLRATLRDVPGKVTESDRDKLAKMIAASSGEAVLLENDVNNYFKAGVDTKGFSNLRFDFRPDGFTADGAYTAHMLIDIRIKLKAAGRLGLHSDGVYLDDTSIFVEGVKQPESLAGMVLRDINPLLPFSRIPFPVEFKKITMSDTAAIMTSNPQPLVNGDTWVWKK